MTAVPKRKLIEVALPLEAINRESAREKSIRHGHPSTLHLWWARRPLAACRAILFAQLVDDPSAHPERFPTEEEQAKERRRLFDLIERLIIWENTNDAALLAEAHKEILQSNDGSAPIIFDPFAGGGSIPLEAQRLGLAVWASDLNPVSVLINMALVEIPPKWQGEPPSFPGAAGSRLGDWPGATGLVEDIRRYGQWMRDEAAKRLGHLYPEAKLPDGSTAPVIAWIWARTVACPNPACGIAMPLVRSWWLGKKKGKEAYVVPHVVGGRVEYEIGHSLADAPTKESDGTVSRTGSTCIGCGTAVPLAYVRTEGKAGRMSVQLMTIVAEGDRRRTYLPPTWEQEAAGLLPPPELPETVLPHNPWSLKTPNYGLTEHRDLFSSRQQLLLVTLCDLVRELAEGGGPGAESERKRDLAIYLACVIARVADYASSVTTWASHPKMEALRNTFARQSLPMAWDFAEGNPWSSSSGNVLDSVRMVADVLARVPAGPEAFVSQADARLVRASSKVLATDPPYYDNVDYSDLSDFFYIWERLALSSTRPAMYTTMLTPKADEMIANPYRFEGNREASREFFRQRFATFADDVVGPSTQDMPGTIFYAFKQSESEGAGTVSTGWATMLQGLVDAGLLISATWPIRSEMSARILAKDTNALASSVVLAVRKRAESAGAANRRSFLSFLKSELPRALRELQQGSVAPVDLAQAAIGPGMAVFSRFSKVVEADGSDMTVRTALALINQVLDEVLSEQEGDFDADTRFCVKWFTQYGWTAQDFGHADQLSRSTNTSAEGLVRGGVFWARAGRARLIAPEELSDAWDPITDERISVWEGVLRLARTLDAEGGEEAARLMALVGQRIDLDAAKELGYLLYSICEKKGWTDAAVLFNGLGTSWSDLSAAARTGGSRTPPPAQGALDFDEDE